MTNPPIGLRTESTRSPKASRAGALHATQRHSTSRQISGHHLLSGSGPRAQRLLMNDGGDLS